MSKKTLSGGLFSDLLEAEKTYGGLTIKQWEISQLICRGYTNGGIGQVLGISPETVKTHLRAICKKLKIKRRTEIAAWAARR